MSSQTGLSFPQAITMRPLDKGIINNKPSTGLEPGAFTRILNYEATQGGLQRRGGFSRIAINSFSNAINAGNNGFSDTFRTMFNVFTLTENPQTMLVGDNFYYNLVQDGGSLKAARFSTRIPAFSSSFEGYYSIFIEQLADDQYIVWMPSVLFSVAPAADNFVEVRPQSTSHNAAWTGQNTDVSPFVQRQGWGTLSWSEVAQASTDTSSIWLKILDVDVTETIAGVDCYPLLVYDNSTTTPKLFASWSYVEMMTGRWFAIAEAGYEPAVYADDLHPLQWTETSRRKQSGTGIELQPALYLTTTKLEKLQRLQVDETTPIEVSLGTKGYCNCVCWHRGYLFVGNYMEGAIRKFGNIAWSSPVDTDNWATTTSWINLQSTSELVALVSFGQYIVALFGDSIWMGYPSNITGLPFKFEKIETGGVGLVNPAAWTIWKDSLFFVGQNNVYRIGADGALSTIGDAVAPNIFYDPSLRKTLAYSRLVTDPINEHIVFSVPTAEAQNFSLMYIFNWKAMAWSQWSIASWESNPPTQTTGILELSCSGMGYSGLTSKRTYDDYDQTSVELPAGDANRIDAQTGAYDAFNNQLSQQRLFLFKDNILYSYAPEKIFCELAEYFPLILETPDMDFDQAELNKIVTEWGLKLTTGVAFSNNGLGESWSGPTPLMFRIFASRDRGSTWQNFGRLRIPTTKNEGIATQPFLGAVVRFRVVLENRFSATITVPTDDGPTMVPNNLEKPFTILEYHVRARGGGKETFY